MMALEKEYNLDTPGTAVAVAWSPDGLRLAAASNFGQVLSVWDHDGHIINRFERIGGGPALAGSIAFTGGASQLIFAPPEDAGSDAALAIWSISNGQVSSTIDGPQKGDGEALNRARFFTLSSDQKTLMLSTIGRKKWDKNFKANIILYDTDSWNTLGTSGLNDSISSIGIFDNGRLAAAGTPTGRVSIIDSRTGSIREEFSAYEPSKYGSVAIAAVAGSPDGQLVLVGTDSPSLIAGFNEDPGAQKWQEANKPLRLFRAQDGRLVHEFVDANPPIRQILWEPNGRYVAFIDDQDGLFIWPEPYDEKAYTKVTVPNLSLSFAIAPDGKNIAATTAQGVAVFSIK